MPSIRRAVLLVCALAATLAPTVPAGAAAASSDRSDRAAPSARDYKPWGRAVSRNLPLRGGCHTYRFRYKITIPEEGRDDWAAEFFIRKPNGRALASPVAIIGSDPLRGRKAYRVCRASTSYGRHQIRMKVTWTDDARNNHEGFVRPSYFRLYRP